MMSLGVMQIKQMVLKVKNPFCFTQIIYVFQTRSWNLTMNLTRQVAVDYVQQSLRMSWLTFDQHLCNHPLANESVEPPCLMLLLQNA